jgi:hypothetical protein
MVPEGSLPCSQEPSIGPYSEPDQSNPYHPTYLSKLIQTAMINNRLYFIPIIFLTKLFSNISNMCLP